MSLLIELAFSLAASVNDCTRCRIESLVLAGLVGALMVRLPGCCWNSSRMSAASDAGVAACEQAMCVSSSKVNSSHYREVICTLPL